MNLSDLAIPVIFAAAVVYGLVKKTDIFDSFTDGVKTGLKTVLDVFPALLALIVGIGMMRASGALDCAADLLKPVTDLLHIPSEVTPLLLLRPFSGSGAVAVYDDIVGRNGADSLAARLGGIILGGSETTFFTLGVYFSAVKVSRTRHALPAAVSGDLIMWLLCGICAALIGNGVF